MCASSATHLEEQQGMRKFPVRLRYPLFSSIYFLIKKRNYIRRKRRPRCSAPCLFIPRDSAQSHCRSFLFIFHH